MGRTTSKRNRHLQHTAAADHSRLAAGAITDVVFLALHRWFGAFAFVLFGVVSAAGGVYVYRNVPETKGKQLQEVQALVRALHPSDSGAADAVCWLSV